MERWPQQAPEAIGALLDAVFASAARAWPTVQLDEERFGAHLIARLPQHLTFDAALQSLHTGDLYLACACVHRVPEAIALFESRFLSAIEGTVARIDRSADFRDEVRQRLRERILVGDPPRIVDYNGSGPLEGWLRIAAMRLALNAQREARRNAKVRVPAPHVQDPELDAIVGQYREQFEKAFRTALSRLSTADRELLRLHYVERLNFERIGERQRIDRSNASRRTTAARQLLLRETHREFARLVPAVTTSSRDSLLRVLRSHIDLNLESILRA
jgi:RNA polymerase sigma-70 factor (ECF subfamily)